MDKLWCVLKVHMWTSPIELYSCKESLHLSTVGKKTIHQKLTKPPYSPNLYILIAVFYTEMLILAVFYYTEVYHYAHIYSF